MGGAKSAELGPGDTGGQDGDGHVEPALGAAGTPGDGRQDAGACEGRHGRQDVRGMVHPIAGATERQGEFARGRAAEEQVGGAEGERGALADEVFAGYPRYRGGLWAQRYRRLPGWLLLGKQTVQGLCVAPLKLSGGPER